MCRRGCNTATLQHCNTPPMADRVRNFQRSELDRPRLPSTILFLDQLALYVRPCSSILVQTAWVEQSSPTPKVYHRKIWSPSRYIPCNRLEIKCNTDRYHQQKSKV